MLPSDPAARHRAIAGTFTDLVRGTRSWEAPAPVDGWVARDVVGHLVEWFPGFLASGAGIELPTGPPVGTDPVAAWQVHADGVQAVLDDPATAGRTLSNPHIGDLPLDMAIDRFYTSDVFMHAWDLATATGQEHELDADTSAEMLAGMEPMEEVIRSSGQYGPRVPVPDDASAQDRLIAFIGRDPSWRPPV
ncbi:TIGR03086 family metal-binding protein [Nocardioides sp. LHG3406-4]|uniref:TIGR03086 family metal-binding protein n=1 Tax=Nocardioides sp. LHG3406-4 TaxID=2804575 RepID=UPI003CEEB342